MYGALRQCRAFSNHARVLVFASSTSAQWSAPELFETRMAMLSFKTDVYSFGVLMWEILTLRAPDRRRGLRPHHSRYLSRV